MSTIISSDEEEFRLYEDRVRHLRHDFFKMETLQQYADDYSPGFRDYENGKINLDELRNMLKEFLINDEDSTYNQFKERDIKYRRLHLVDIPISGYLHYEIESYIIGAEFGEEIFLLTTKEASALNLSAPLVDTIIFDNEIVYVQHFEVSTGLWKFTEIIENAKEVAKHVEVKDTLLQNAMPLDDFLRHYLAG